MDREIDYKKLRDFREDKDLKQKQVADKLNMSQSAYSRIERGERGIRAEHLKVLAENYGKNINDFFKKIKGMENNSPQEVKAEVGLLESIFCKISAEVESELFTLIYRYDSNYPEYPLSFEDYLTDAHLNPEMAIDQIKYGIEQFKQGDSYPAFYSMLGENEIEYLMNRSDEWLHDFVTKEENYEIVHAAMMSPHCLNEEDSFSAFKDMLNENSVIHRLFQYGLLENSWFSNYWKKYLSEMKTSPSGDGTYPAQIQKQEIFLPVGIDYVETAERRKERERIREKLKGVFVRNQKD